MGKFGALNLIRAGKFDELKFEDKFALSFLRGKFDAKFNQICADKFGSNFPNAANLTPAPEGKFK